MSVIDLKKYRVVKLTDKKFFSDSENLFLECNISYLSEKDIILLSKLKCKYIKLNTICLKECYLLVKYQNIFL